MCQHLGGFFEFVEGRKAPKLPGLRFAVLALGDSTYEHFCQAGKRLDRRLEELGARRISDRVDCDVDYEDAAAAWLVKAIEEHEQRVIYVLPCMRTTPRWPALAKKLNLPGT